MRLAVLTASPMAWMPAASKLRFCTKPNGRFFPADYAGAGVWSTLAHSQAAGAVIQGIGYALYEAREVDSRTGDVLSGGIAVWMLGQDQALKAAP